MEELKVGDIVYVYWTTIYPVYGKYVGKVGKIKSIDYNYEIFDLIFNKYEVVQFYKKEIIKIG